MKFAGGLSLKMVTEAGDRTIPQSRLFYRDVDLNLQLPGAVLEAVIQTNSEWLLFLTHDVPYEEGLEICLLDERFQLLDRATIAAPNVTAAFEHLEIVSDRKVRFEFLGKRAWTASLLKGTSFRLPLLTEPLGVSRSFGLCRRFAISPDE